MPSIRYNLFYGIYNVSIIKNTSEDTDMNTKWTYGFALNHEGAGVGTIYYAEEYFDREGIVNPASAAPLGLDARSHHRSFDM